jgi:hypothetical protein
VEPHVLGYKNTKLELLAWQLKSNSKVELTNEWRTFEVQKITNISVKTQTFSGVSYSHAIPINSASDGAN